MLGAAVASGLCSAGVDATSMGVVPTGGISYVARTGDFGMAVVISASHNPAPDNGIKLLGHDGRKLPDEAELRIEERMGHEPRPRPVEGAVGELRTSREDVSRYMEYLEGLLPKNLEGLRVAVDAANGAAYELGPEIFRRLGADVVAIGTEPDGMNINQHCGATSPHAIQTLTKDSGADIGVAFDGDADRAVFSDSKGRLINGDRAMAIWCSARASVAPLDPPVVVGTVMSNMGFERRLSDMGIRLERAPVGDKYVAAKMQELGAHVGGEQSGHLIFPDFGPTGDGLITALMVLGALRETGRDAASFYDEFENWPQLLVNVSVAQKEGWQDAPRVVEAIGEAESALEGRGRVNVRASGTQPMIRVMVECDSAELRDALADKIVDALLAEQGGQVYGRVDLTHALGD